MGPAANTRRGGLWLVALLFVTGSLSMIGTSSALGVDQPVGDATAVVETTPVAGTGDAADDPAIWRHPTDPSRSLVIGNDKMGALEVYGLDGVRIQRITGGGFGNVDVRYGLQRTGGPVDVAVTWRSGIRIYAINPATRQLTNITEGGTIAAPIIGEGLCLYESPLDGSTYVFTISRPGQVAQMRLADNDADGLVEATTVRQWSIGSESEGCVADDELGHLYVSEEAVAIWKYSAEPTAPTTPENRVAVDRPIAAGGHFRPDAEGLTIVYQPNGTGYLIASSQAASDSANSYLVFERQGANAFLREFKVVASAQTDNCGRTDGIDALAADLGPAFPHGLFVCQDNANTAPLSGNQNFKLVPLERVVGLGEGPPPEPQPPVARIDTDCTLLVCELDGTRSTDDGSITSYVWDFGDGEGSTAVAPLHGYAAPGTYVVTLTVTDDEGLTGSATSMLTVTDQAPQISFVQSAVSNANATSHRVTVPAAVAAGDGLLLFLGVNTSATVTGPTGVTGWQALGVVTMSGASTRVWRKVAAPGDAGAQVQVTLSTISKANLTLLVYRGTSSTNPVASASGVRDTVSRTDHPTPVVATTPGTWAVSYWTHKDSTSALLSPPAGVTVRANGTQSGSGSVKALVADAPVTGTSYGGLVATAGSANTNASAWTIVLAPG